jgi:hypothetical protein
MTDKKENVSWEVATADKPVADGLVKHGRNIIEKTIEAGRAYLDMCIYIRENKAAPRLVSHVLSELGFHKTRISEINRVAQLPDAEWNQFAARTIGFRGALQLARGNPVHETLAADAEGRHAQEDLDKVIDVESESVESNLQSTSEQKEKRAKSAAVGLASVAEFLNWKKRTFNVANGYTVVVSKTKTGRKPPGVSANDNK